MTYSFVLRLFFSSSNLLPWSVGRYNLIWPIWGCATGQIMVFVLFTLNRVNNFPQVCPEQGIQFRQVWASPKQCPHSLSYSGSGFQTFGSPTYTQILVEYPLASTPNHHHRYHGYQWFFLGVAIECSRDALSHLLVGVSSAKGWSYELPGYQCTDFYSPHPNILLSLLTGLTWCFTYVVLEWVSSCCPGKIPILKFEVCWDGYAGGLWPGGKSLRPEKFCLKKCTDQTV